LRVFEFWVLRDGVSVPPKLSNYSRV
jgi:hypothetical protein